MSSEAELSDDEDVNGLGCGCLLVPGGTAIRHLCKWHEATTFPKTWAGFRAFLDEMYPDDIFPDKGRDLGPSFVVAARRLSKVENDLAALRGRVREWLAKAEPYPELNGNKFAEVRAALAGVPVDSTEEK